MIIIISLQKGILGHRKFNLRRTMLFLSNQQNSDRKFIISLS